MPLPETKDLQARNLIAKYFQETDGSYMWWGQDPTRDGLYSLHFGFFPAEQSQATYADNQFALNSLIDQLIQRSGTINGEHVLDAGCGTGTLAFSIAERFPDSVVCGVNIVNVQLSAAADYRERTGVRNAYFLLQDYHQLGFSDMSFNRIFFCESFTHSNRKQDLLNETSRLLKPNGRLIMADCFVQKEELTDEEKDWLEQLSSGWAIPYFVRGNQVLDMLKVSGFQNVLVGNGTPNVLLSAKLLADICEEKLLEPDNTTAEVTLLNRKASIAFYRLLTAGTLGYYFITAEKN